MSIEDNFLIEMSIIETLMISFITRYIWIDIFYQFIYNIYFNDDYIDNNITNNNTNNNDVINTDIIDKLKVECI
jgi:hypothetical protein